MATYILSFETFPCAKKPWGKIILTNIKISNLFGHQHKKRNFGELRLLCSFKIQCIILCSRDVFLESFQPIWRYQNMWPPKEVLWGEKLYRILVTWCPSNVLYLYSRGYQKMWPPTQEILWGEKATLENQHLWRARLIQTSPRHRGYKWQRPQKPK